MEDEIAELQSAVGVPKLKVILFATETEMVERKLYYKILHLRLSSSNFRVAIAFKLAINLE